MGADDTLQHSLDATTDPREHEPDGTGSTDAIGTAGDDATEDVPATTDAARERWYRFAGAGLVFVGLLWFWRGFQIEGHGWGDDFSLYVNQARSLVQGDVGRTIADNHFAVDNSAWHTFSPYVYPWGLPLLLAPVMMLTGTVDPTTGIDFGPLKLVISLSFAVALFAYHHVCRRRVHLLGAVLLPAFFATTYWFVIHTDQILSELPFLMWVMLFLVWLDRVRERDLLLGSDRWQLVVLGVLALMAFSTRREGLGLAFGLLAAQAVAVWCATERDTTISTTGAATDATLATRWRRLGELDWKALTTPWATFIGGAAALQLVLPSELLPKYTERDPAADTGLHRLIDNPPIYKPLLAEQLGLKDPGPTDITAFQSARLGEIVLYLILGFAIFGLVLAAITRPRRDAGLVASAVGLTLAVMVAPFQDYRYLMPLLPFLLLFALMGVSIPIRAALRLAPKWPTLVGEIALVALILGGLPDTMNAYDYRSAWEGPQAGPQEPATLEMWSAVRDHTRGDDVIVFGRARSMGLYTGRKAVQGGAIEFIERAGDFYVMYLNSDGSPGDYSQYPLDRPEARERGFTEVWRNHGWVIWRTPTSRAALP